MRWNAGFPLAVALVFLAGPAQAIECRMPNGKVVSFRNKATCPADADQVDDAGEVVRPRTAAQAPPAARHGNKVVISERTWPGAWPFALPSGTLECLRERTGPRSFAPLVVFHGSDGLTYTVNGAAKGRGPARGWHPSTAIWRPNPQIPGARIPMGDMIERGLELCE
jgi:hypothetical protein